jgi:hypothetical protein
MSDIDAETRKEYTEAGVDLPELAAEPEAPAAATPTEPEAPAEPEVEAPATPEGDAPPEPTEPRKRSIYDDLKDKKSELKTEKQLREQAERERDELQTKLDAATHAATPEERKEAKDEIDEFIASHKDWDKAAISDLISLARKGFKAEIPETVAADLKEFQQWKTENSKAIEEAQFAREFEAAVPSLKEMFPSASDEELKAVRAEIEKLAFTKEYHDKDIDYIAFKNRSKLEPLISPRKPGMERRGRVDSQAVEFEFDPNADYSKMSPAEREKWEANYDKATSSESLLEGADGKKILL